MIKEILTRVKTQDNLLLENMYYKNLRSLYKKYGSLTTDRCVQMCEESEWTTVFSMLFNGRSWIVLIHENFKVLYIKGEVFKRYDIEAVCDTGWRS